MTFEERNKMIKEVTAAFQELHDKYTSTTQILTSEQWDEYIESMRAKLDTFKGTNLYRMAEELWMSFLNDTEYVQKELKKVNEKSRTNKTA